MTRRRFGSITRKTTPTGRTYFEAHYLPPRDARGDPGMPKRITRRFPDGFELQAEKWLADVEASMRLGTWQPPSARRARERSDTTTFGEYAANWIETRHRADGEPVRETTKQKYRESVRNHLLETFGAMPVSRITPHDIQKWYDGFPVRKGGIGEGARRAAYRTLRAILNTAATQPVDGDGNTLIERSPALLRSGTFHTRHVSLIAEVDELEILRRRMPANLAIAVPLAGFLGLREGECVGLRRRDVDLGNVVLHVRHALKPVYDADGHRTIVLGLPKSASSVRDLALPDFMVSLLREHMERFTGDDPDDFLIIGRTNGSMVAPQSLRNTWERVREAVPRLKTMRFHDLRHTALTRLAEMGATNGELMAQAGHTSLKVASVYQQASDSHRKEVMRRLDRAMSGTPEQSIDSTKPSDLVEELRKLSELHEEGVLDEAEFKAAKKRLLEG